MKKLVITALSTEQSFSIGGPTKYFLVINDGELRIQVKEDMAEKIVELMYKDASPDQEEEPHTEAPSITQGNSKWIVDDDALKDEDGVAQV
jgi:hypothetical protein